MSAASSRPGPRRLTSSRSGLRPAVCALLLATAALPSRADDVLLGLCSVVGDARCTAATSWSVGETALTPLLTSPIAARAAYSITVTEGATSRVLTATDVITLSGLVPSGTHVAALYLGVQRADGDGLYTTVATAAVGDLSASCGCPYIANSATMTVRDASGAALAGTPLLSLPFGQQQSVALDLRWSLAQGIVRPTDTLRLQPCVAWVPDGVSLPAGCHEDGGSVRTVKACSALPVACGLPPTILTETLGLLSSPIATLSGFTASTTSPSLTPPTIAQGAGGSSVSFTATPTGVAGTQSVVTVQGAVTCGPAAGSATLADSAAIDGKTASAQIALTCPAANPGTQCADLGGAAPFNVFMRHAFKGDSCDIEGALAAGGKVVLGNYTIGAVLPVTTPPALALVVGGTLDFHDGWIYGDAQVVGASHLTRVGQTGTTTTGATSVSFSAVQSHLTALSAQLAGLYANGTATSSGGYLNFSGTSATLNVFTIPASSLSGLWGIGISAPASSIAVINITGASPLLSAIDFGGTSALPPGHVLYNFPQATAVTLSSIGLLGSVLAPLAAVQFNNGALEGQLIADSFSGNGQVNWKPLAACLPLPAP